MNDDSGDDNDYDM